MRPCGLAIELKSTCATMLHLLNFFKEQKALLGESSAGFT